MKVEGQTIEYTENSESFTPERAAQIFFLSYYFSRGSPIAQHRLLNWIHKKFPHYKIKEEDLAKVKEIAEAKIRNYLRSQPTQDNTGATRGHGYQNPKQIAVGIDDEFRLFEGIFSEGDEAEEGIDELQEKFFSDIMRKDFENIKKAEAIPGTKSFIFTYIFNEKKTPLKEYDAIFDAVRESVITQKGRLIKPTSFTQNDLAELKAVIDNFNKNHPGEEFFPETQL